MNILILSLLLIASFLFGVFATFIFILIYLWNKAVTITDEDYRNTDEGDYASAIDFGKTKIIPKKKYIKAKRL